MGQFAWMACLAAAVAAFPVAAACYLRDDDLDDPRVRRRLGHIAIASIVWVVGGIAALAHFGAEGMPGGEDYSLFWAAFALSPAFFFMDMLTQADMGKPADALTPEQAGAIRRIVAEEIKAAADPNALAADLARRDGEIERRIARCFDGIQAHAQRMKGGI